MPPATHTLLLEALRRGQTPPTHNRPPSSVLGSVLQSTPLSTPRDSVTQHTPDKTTLSSPFAAHTAHSTAQMHTATLPTHTPIQPGQESEHVHRPAPGNQRIFEESRQEGHTSQPPSPSFPVARKAAPPPLANLQQGNACGQHRKGPMLLQPSMEVRMLEPQVSERAGVCVCVCVLLCI